MSQAENAKAMRQLADFYHQFAINILPLGNDKRPVVTGVAPSGRPTRFAWEDWQTMPQTPALWPQIRKPAWWTEVHGIALICGAVSGNLVLVDFDDCAPTPEFWQTLNLPDTYAWAYPTPGNGWHVWLALDAAPDINKGKLDNPGIHGGSVEIRWTGHYGVAPGSMHPDTNTRYQWRGDPPTTRPATISPITLLDAYWRVALPATPPATPAPAPQQQSTPGSASSYALTALAGELLALREATEGNRNNALNRAAFSLGQLVAGGELDATRVEQALLDAAHDIGLSEGEARATIHSGMTNGAKSPRTATHNGNGASFTAYPGFGPAPDAEPDPTAPLATDNTWPYAAHDGRIFFQRETRDGIQEACIADFQATIAEEIVDEDGATVVVLAGQGVRSGAFACTIPTSDLGNALKLRGALTAATGGVDAIYKGMSEHLQPAIAKLTQIDHRRKRRRYSRTGWRDDNCTEFLLPPLANADTEILLPTKLPYSLDADPNTLQRALPYFDNLIAAVTPTKSAPALAALFFAAAHRLIGWRNERTALFIAGRTGSLKTSWTQAAMCIFGAHFADDNRLIKWGEGATRNAIMSMAAQAHDMPFFIDNYKPTTGNGKADFKNLIHNIMEGSDKDRLNRAAQLRTSKAIHCVPIITGEDVPDDDAASLARILVINFDWQRGAINELLADVQSATDILPAIGYAWLSWLASADGRHQAQTTAAMFAETRRTWAAYLSNQFSEMANSLRVVTNLTTNALTWQLLCKHPILGPIAARYTDQHTEGLRAIATTMGAATTRAQEAVQWLHAVQELLSSGQYRLLDRAVGVPTTNHDKILGWFDSSGVYLLPAVVTGAVRQLLGASAPLVSPQTLYNQMKSLGWVAATGEDSTTKILAIGADRARVLHLRPNVLNGYDDADDDDNDLDASAILGDLGL